MSSKTKTNDFEKTVPPMEKKIPLMEKTVPPIISQNKKIYKTEDKIHDQEEASAEHNTFTTEKINHKSFSFKEINLDKNKAYNKKRFENVVDTKLKNKTKTFEDKGKYFFIHNYSYCKGGKNHVCIPTTIICFIGK
jgi:hypothetical protein